MKTVESFNPDAIASEIIDVLAKGNAHIRAYDIIFEAVKERIRNQVIVSSKPTVSRQLNEL